MNLNDNQAEDSGRINKRGWLRSATFGPLFLRQRRTKGLPRGPVARETGSKGSGELGLVQGHPGRHLSALGTERATMATMTAWLIC